MRKYRKSKKRKSKNKLSFPALLVFGIGVVTAILFYRQHPLSPEQPGDIRIMFYNVENFFDTEDNPNKNDNDFLPNGKYYWTKTRYNKKVSDVAKVIAKVGGEKPPVIVGMCEIENATVASDIVSQPELKEFNYKSIVTDSKDRRGINVALLYRSNIFKVINKQTYYPVVDPQNPNKLTRDILHVTGLAGKDTLDVFVCHFYSRVGGEKESRHCRINSARSLKQKVDSLKKVRAKANIVIMGDFNDYPNDASMSQALDARSIDDTPKEGKQLYNLFRFHHKPDSYGSYKYKGYWDFFDQIIVSGIMLDEQNCVTVAGKSGYVYTDEQLVERDKFYGGLIPYRTYQGENYLGGISDHLPVYVDLKLGCNNNSNN